MKQPKYLQPGNKIGITCPSGYVSAERIAFAVEVLQQWGFEVVIGNTVGKEYHYFSGTDAARVQDLQQMMDNPEIAAILMGRGGYGMTRIIDQIDFTAFAANPKWICGFSDITVLHSHIHRNYGIPTLHSVMCGAFKPETAESDYIKSLYRMLTGETMTYSTSAHPFNRQGNCAGILTGGNLAILAHLTGSASEATTDGKILFIEDIGEHLYNIDRLLYQLKRAGKLNNLAGLIVGSFTDLQDTERPFGQTVEEIIWDKVQEYSYPVCFGFPCGHQDENYTLGLGMPQTLEVTENGAVLKVQPMA
jgi:muramoyltetrapeptide carboxypeptidase